MNYDNTCVNSMPMPINDCCESGPSHTTLANLKETTDLLHMIEGHLDSIRGSLWFNDGSTPEKDIEIKDMDSNLVHNRDVAKRILKKLDTMVARIGC